MSTTPRTVYLGNRDAYEDLGPDPDDNSDQPRRLIRDLPGKRCTTVNIPDGWSLIDALNAITNAGGGAWQAHSKAAAPAWVASTDPALAHALAEHWGCELRDPEPDHQPSGEA